MKRQTSNFPSLAAFIADLEAQPLASLSVEELAALHAGVVAWRAKLERVLEERRRTAGGLQGGLAGAERGSGEAGAGPARRSPAG